MVSSFNPRKLSMIKKSDLIEYLGGTPMNAACRLGYDTIRPDNNITRLPKILTAQQEKVIRMRMKSKRIKIPAEWL